MEHPEIFKPEQYQSKLSTLNPVYGLTKGLTNNTVVKAIHSAFEATGDVPEYLPEQIAKALDLMGEETAVSYIHFPPDQDSLVRARSRLAFDEFFLFILALRMLRQEEGDKASGFRIPETWLTEDVIERLPFRLTKGQMNVWREIEQDLSSGRRMSRLVQGDVGSGKTILAFLAMIMTASSGYQSVLMAPTEVLARQHYEKLANMCREQGLDTVRPVLLTGTLTAAERRATLEEIESGLANAIVGTHALIQSSVKYRNPALIITDEQHRFGVYQRQALAERDCPPHMLVMSATPIPRTLGVIFGQTSSDQELRCRPLVETQRDEIYKKRGRCRSPGLYRLPHDRTRRGASDGERHRVYSETEETVSEYRDRQSARANESIRKKHRYARLCGRQNQYPCLNDRDRGRSRCAERYGNDDRKCGALRSCYPSPAPGTRREERSAVLLYIYGGSAERGYQPEAGYTEPFQ